jgi:hypothetical protein
MRRLLKRLLYLGIGLTVLILAFYVEEDWRGKRDWEKYKAEWEAKGERFDLAALTPTPVPDDQNFVKAPIIASIYAGSIDRNGNRINPPNTNIVNRLYLNIYGYSLGQKAGSNPYRRAIADLDRNGERKSYWPTIGNWQVGEITDLHDWQLYFHSPKEFIQTNEAAEAKRRTEFIAERFRGRGTPPPMLLDGMPKVVLPDDSFPLPSHAQSPPLDVLVGLSKFDSDLAELRTAARLPYSILPLTYDRWDIYSPSYGTLEFPGEILVLRSVAELACEHSAEAFDDVKLIFRLAALIPNQSFPGPQRTRQILLHFALQPIWEGLATRRWSDDQLAAIDGELATLDLMSDYQTFIRASRNLRCADIDNLPVLFKAAITNVNDQFDAPLQKLYDCAYCAIPGGWLFQNKIRLCKAYNDLLALWDAQNGTISKKLIHGRLLPGEHPSYWSSTWDSRDPYNQFVQWYLYWRVVRSPSESKSERVIFPIPSGPV